MVAAKTETPLSVSAEAALPKSEDVVASPSTAKPVQPTERVPEVAVVQQLSGVSLTSEPVESVAAAGGKSHSCPYCQEAIQPNDVVAECNFFSLSSLFLPVSANCLQSC